MLVFRPRGKLRSCRKKGEHAISPQKDLQDSELSVLTTPKLCSSNKTTGSRWNADLLRLETHLPVLGSDTLLQICSPSSGDHFKPQLTSSRFSDAPFQFVSEVPRRRRASQPVSWLFTAGTVSTSPHAPPSNARKATPEFWCSMQLIYYPL